VFRAWQVVVTCVAATYMLIAINNGTAFIIAIPSALLIMSILAADADA